MKMSLKYRQIIGDARRVVVKLGSRVLVQKTGRPDVRRMRHIVSEVAKIHKAGCEVAIVTSGAVGAGMEALHMKERPSSLPDLQMAAAVGQSKLMACYDDLFSELHCRVGQVLLTHDDFKHKVRVMNAKRTMENLLRHKVIPVINENDVVADEEIRAVKTLGDNDFMASLVVKLIRADLLLLMSTVEGVQEVLPSGKVVRVKYIEKITSRTFRLVKDSKSMLSKGGMGSKLKAARDVSAAGCTSVIANGRRNNVITDIMKGKDVGTIVLAAGL